MPGITEDEPSILEQAPENQESEQRFLEKSSFSQSDYSYDNSERLNANNDEQNEFNEGKSNCNIQTYQDILMERRG